jgi:hypothetical protein
MITAREALALALPTAALAVAGSGGYVVVGGVPREVTQGPAALAALLYAPPGWVAPALGLASAGVLAAAALGYRRAGGVDAEVAAEMLDNAITVALMGGLTLALAHAAPLPYFLDVGLGSAIGYAASRAAASKLLAENIGT